MANKKKILVLNGSPKKEKSTTLVITRAFVQGIEETLDAETEYIHLSDLQIKPCTGCLSCWSKTEGTCVMQDDDIAPLKEKIENADIFIESYPLYFFGMPGQMKVFTDRMLSMMKTYEGQCPPNNGESLHGIRGGKTGKGFVVFSACAYSQTEEVYESLLKQYDCICGEKNYTAVLCSQIQTLVDLGANARLERYLNPFVKAGREYAQTKTLCEETKKRLLKPPFSHDTYKILLDNFWERRKNGR